MHLGVEPNLASTACMTLLAGVNVQPQGLSIGPTLIVIGPYDTTVAGQVQSWPHPLPSGLCAFARHACLAPTAGGTLPRGPSVPLT